MNTSEYLSDEEICHSILAGQKALFEIIVRRYNPVLYKIGRSYNYNHQDTEDLMQESFVDAYKNLAGFEGRSLFKTWLIKIMLNNCYRKKQKSALKNETMQTINNETRPLFTQQLAGAEAMVQQHQMRNIIESALTAVPADYRMVFALREMNELSVAETAGLLGISEANVKVRLLRAKKLLRTQIEKAYSPQDLFEFHLSYCNALTQRVMNAIEKI